MKKMRNISFPLLMVPAVLLGLGGLTSCSEAFGSPDTYNIDVNVDTRGAVINFYTGFGGGVNAALRDDQGNGLLTDFENLTGITVKYSTKGGYDGLKKAINLSATNPKGLPQIANGYPDHFAGYVSSNIQLRLDGLIENDKNRDINEAGSYLAQDGVTKITTLPHFNYDDFYRDYCVENETLEFKEDGTGYILGIPFNKSTEEMVYNKTFFDWFAKDAYRTFCTNKGIEYREIKVPNTWDELSLYGQNIVKFFDDAELWGKILEEDGSIVESDDNTKETIFLGTNVTKEEFRPFSYDSTENLFTTLVRQFGGTLTTVDPKITGKGYINYDSEAGRKAGDLILKLWNEGVLGVPANPFGEDRYCSNPFKGYKSVMNVGSTAGIANSVGTFKVALHPVLYTDAEHKFVLSQGTSLGLFQIPAKDKDRDKKIMAAWKLIVFLSQAENARFSIGTGYFPSCESAAESQLYKDFLENDLSSAKDQAQKDTARVNKEYYLNKEQNWIKFTDPGFRGSSEIRVQMGLIPGYLIDGRFDKTQDAIDETKKQLADYIPVAQAEQA